MLKLKNYISKNFGIIKNFIYFFGIKPSGLPNWKKLINNVQKTKISKIVKDKKNVLICTSGGSHKVVNIFNSLIAFALSFKGCKVEFLLCDKVLPACQMAAMDFVSNEKYSENGPKSLCNHCLISGNSSFENMGLIINHYSKYLVQNDFEYADKVVNSISNFDNISHFKIDKIDIGEHALAGALRYFAVGSLNVIEEKISKKILKRYIKAAILIKIAFERIIKEKNPDVILLDHGLYVPNGIIMSVAKKNNIKRVAFMTSYRKNTILFSRNDTYHKTFVSEKDSHWRNIDFNIEIKKKIENYLHSRRFGTNDWEFYYNKPIFDIDKFKQKYSIKNNVVTYMTNIIWDAQLEFPSNIFSNMMESIIETIKFFEKREDITLIIRVHPGEKNHDRPSNQKVEDEIRSIYPNLLKNLIIIGPDNPISSYALAEISDSVIIYGSKIGLEISSMGIPVIVSGEAWLSHEEITIKPKTKKEYFEILDKLPFKKRLNQNQIDLAKKFSYHFFFRRMIEIKSLDYYPKKWPPYKIKDDIYNILQDKRDPALELITNSIIYDEDFIFKDENYLN